MPSSHSKFPRRLAAVVLVLGTSMTACSDATAPEWAAGDPGHLTISNATYSGQSIDMNVLYPTLTQSMATKVNQPGVTAERFTVSNAQGAVIRFANGSRIAFPRNTLCDPKTNSYGSTEWLKPCTLATTPITFQVRTWVGASGRPYAEFSPRIRFNPSAAEPVRMYFMDATLTNFSTVYIPFCTSPNSCIDERLTDSTLETYVSPLSGGGYWVYRTLRHFSGYTVTAD